MNSTAASPDVSTHRVRVEGRLDVVRASDATFILRLDDGRELSGRLVRGSVAGLGRVLGRHIIVFGTTRFGASGEVAEIEVDGFIPNDGRPWTREPDDFPVSQDVTAELARRWAEVRRTRPELFVQTRQEAALNPPASSGSE